MKSSGKFHQESYSCFIDWLRSCVINSSTGNDALSLARIYAEMQWINHGGLYHDEAIEDFVEKKVLESKKYNPPIFTNNSDETVVVASELYNHGGHSPVVFNWMMLFAANNNHKLLVTRTVNNIFNESLLAKKIVYHLCHAKGLGLIVEILNFASNATRVVLHIHPNDIESAVAASILSKAGKDIIFYNHADHVFTYGICKARIVCEVSSYGIFLNHRLRRTKEFCLLGIPIKNNNIGYSDELKKQCFSGRNILSCGNAAKYAPGKFFYGDFIDSMLQRKPEVIFFLIGPTGKEPWWKNYIERWGSSVRFLGVLGHAEYLKVLLSADVYVDSFPITGGSAFPEALLNGKLVAGIHQPIQGYSPADELKVGSISELTEQVIKLLDRDMSSVFFQEDVKARTATYHSLNRFRENIISIYEGRQISYELPDVEVNTFWIQSNWCECHEIHLPSWLSFRELKPANRIKFIINLRKIFRFINYVSLSKLVFAFFINPRWPLRIRELIKYFMSLKSFNKNRQL